MTEREKMLSGEWADPMDSELKALRDRAAQLMQRLNNCIPSREGEYVSTLAELCPHATAGFIRAPFYCDYGVNIFLGEDVFINFDCVFLDLAPIRIGRGTLIGPKVQLLTAHHSLEAEHRATGLETGLTITIGEYCWLGGGAIVCPGVTIGDRCIIGAGSVVTHDIPADSVAVGNPARVIRQK